MQKRKRNTLITTRGKLSAHDGKGKWVFQKGKHMIENNRSCDNYLINITKEHSKECEKERKKRCEHILNVRGEIFQQFLILRINAHPCLLLPNQCPLFHACWLIPMNECGPLRCAIAANDLQQ